MADDKIIYKKISQLDETPEVYGPESVPIVQNGKTFRVTFDTVINWLLRLIGVVTVVNTIVELQSMPVRFKRSVQVLQDGIGGFFKYIEFGEPDGINIFPASDGGVWIRFSGNLYSREEIDLKIDEGIIQSQAGYVSFTGTELPSPETTNNWTWLTGGPGGTTYTHPEGDLHVDEGELWTGIWSDTFWQLDKVLKVPEPTVSNQVEGNTGAVTGVGVFNFALEKEVNAVIDWAFRDDDGNMVMYAVDKKTYISGLAKESIPLPFDLEQSPSFDGVAVGDDFGNLLIINSDNDSSAKPLSNVRDALNTLEYFAPIINKDGVWNQWIEPTVAVDKYGDTWQTSVGTDSVLYLSKISKDGRLGRIKLGEILSNLGNFKSDDHNAPAILFDNRDDAPYPIMIFQVDHNTTPMRFWKFTSLDIETFDTSVYETIGSTNIAYSQPHRYNDEIFVFARRPALPRPWRILYSNDNGVTWAQKDVFYPSATWLYMLTKDSADGAGVHLMSYGHPQNSENQNIYYLYFDFASGEIRNPETGVIVEDLRAAMADNTFVPIDPFTIGLRFYTATGTEINRMWDFKEDEDTITLILTSQMIASPTKTAFETSLYRVVNFNKSDGHINFVQDLNKAGYSASVASDEYSYWAGACLVDPYTAITCQWVPQNILDGGDDVQDAKGKTTVRTITFNGTSKVEKIQWESPLKVIRPYVTKGATKVSFCECKYFTDYSDFYSKILTFNLNTIKY